MPSPQMHDPNNLMRTSGFVSVQHPVEHGMMSAFYTPQPALSAQHLRAALEEAAAKLFRGGEQTQGRQGRTLSRSSREAGRQMRRQEQHRHTAGRPAASTLPVSSIIAATALWVCPVQSTRHNWSRAGCPAPATPTPPQTASTRCAARPCPSAGSPAGSPAPLHHHMPVHTIPQPRLHTSVQRRIPHAACRPVGSTLLQVLSGEPSPVYGCLLFPCVAKGQRYYEEPHVESSMVQVR